MKQLIQRTFLLATATFVMLTATAAPITQQQARVRALTFAREQGRLITQQQAHRAPVKGTTTATQTSPFYVFDFDGQQGYVIISGDDRTYEVLGYTDNGHYDYDALPENMQACLDSYAKAIESLDDAPSVVTQQPQMQRMVPYDSEPIVVAPLMKSTWNQGTPYNNQCPIVEGSRCPSGCVATATAQVMYYYKWPSEITIPIPAHSWTYNDQTYDLDELPPMTIEWSRMRNSYSSSATSEKVMSTFMLYVAQSIKMGFTPKGSGASFGSTRDALRKFYDYDVYYLHRSNYSIQAWEDIFKEQLAKARPVLIEGYTTSGGHAFVCDGINAQGLFHINWGWGGGNDGYFRLSILNPGDNTGIGAAASSDGYCMGQGIIIGWDHASEMENPNQDPIMMNLTEVRLEGNAIKFDAWNAASEPTVFDIALASIEDDESLMLRSSPQTLGELSPGWGWPGQTIDLRSLRLPEGTYRLLPVSHKSGSDDPWYETNRINYVEATYNANKRLTEAILHPIVNITSVDFEYPGDHQIYEKQRIQLTFHNGGDELNREIHLFAGIDGNHGESIMHTALFLPKDGEETLSMWFTPDHAGTMKLWIALDSDCRNIIAEGTYEVQGKERLTTDRGVATFYSDRDYEGTAITLPEGEFTLEQLKEYGIKDDDISSLKMLPGYIVWCFANDNFRGTKRKFASDTEYVGNSYNDTFSSIRIEAISNPGHNGIVRIQNVGSELYWDMSNSTSEGAQVKQRRFYESRRAQLFRLEDTGSGFYAIEAVMSGLYITVNDGKVTVGTPIEQMARDTENPAQEFILLYLDDDRYQIIPRYCGKTLEVPNESKTSGIVIRLADNQQQDFSIWRIQEAEDPDAIAEISMDETTLKTPTADIFDLHGRRISQPRRGVYIKNGHKIIVK